MWDPQPHYSTPRLQTFGALQTLGVCRRIQRCVEQFPPPTIAGPDTIQGRLPHRILINERTLLSSLQFNYDRRGNKGIQMTLIFCVLFTRFVIRPFILLFINLIHILTVQQMFWLERSTAKVGYMLSARDLSITWGDDDRYWRWVSREDSRFDLVFLILFV